MVVRARGWAFDLRLAALDAGTLNGSKEMRVSRAQRLLFMVDATGERPAPNVVDLRSLPFSMTLAIFKAA